MSQNPYHVQVWILESFNHVKIYSLLLLYNSLWIVWLLEWIAFGNQEPLSRTKVCSVSLSPAQKTQVAEGALLETLCIYFPFYIHVMFPYFLSYDGFSFFLLFGGWRDGTVAYEDFKLFKVKWNSLVGKIGTSHKGCHLCISPLKSLPGCGCWLQMRGLYVCVSDVCCLNSTLHMALMVIIGKQLFDCNCCSVLKIVKILTWKHAVCLDYSCVLFVNMFRNTWIA